MVATKLKLPGVSEWIAHEMDGYPPSADVPPYRRLRGDVRANNPFNGVQMPVRVDDANLQALWSDVSITQSIGALHEFCRADPPFLQVPFSHEQVMKLQEFFEEDTWFVPYRRISTPDVRGIFDAVRNRILNWTLELEAQSILGEGMTFSDAEKEKAASTPSVQIGSVQNFQGVIGTVTDSTVSIDSVQSMDAALCSRGFSKEERIEIQRLIAEFKSAPTESRLAVAKRGIEWVMDHALKLGTLASMFRDFFGASR